MNKDIYGVESNILGLQMYSANELSRSVFGQLKPPSHTTYHNWPFFTVGVPKKLQTLESFNFLFFLIYKGMALESVHCHE